MLAMMLGFVLGVLCTLMAGLWIEYLANREYWLLKFLFPAQGSLMFVLCVAHLRSNPIANRAWYISGLICGLACLIMSAVEWLRPIERMHKKAISKVSSTDSDAVHTGPYRTNEVPLPQEELCGASSCDTILRLLEREPAESFVIVDFGVKLIVSPKLEIRVSPSYSRLSVYDPTDHSRVFEWRSLTTTCRQDRRAKKIWSRVSSQLDTKRQEDLAKAVAQELQYRRKGEL